MFEFNIRINLGLEIHIHVSMFYALVHGVLQLLHVDFCGLLNAEILNKFKVK